MRDADLRTLCDSCRADYLEAGFYLKKVWVKHKEECSCCLVRMGWTYELIDPGRETRDKN